MVRAEVSRTVEQQVLLLCARPRIVAADRERIRALTAAGFNWLAVISLAEEHGLWPLVVTHARAAGAAMPADLAAVLERRILETTAINLALSAQLAAIVTGLARNGIACVALKGPVLACHLYGHLGLRPFADLDLLIAPDAVAAAAETLYSAGYRDADDYAIARGIYPAAGRELVFVPDAPSRVNIELQTDVSDWTLPLQLPAGVLIGRARTLHVGGIAIPALSAEDQLLTLVVHGFRHRWGSLRYVTDVHAACADGLDWPLLLARAREARIERMVSAALLLSARLLGTEIPDAAAARARRDRAAAALAGELDRRLFARVAPRYRHLWEDWIAVRSREQVRDRAAYVARTIAFDQIIRPIDEWRSAGAGAGAWRAAKIARRLLLPLAALLLVLAVRTPRPLIVAAASITMLAAGYLLIHTWAARRLPERSWSSRNA
jgi:hypothetical protein